MDTKTHWDRFAEFCKYEMASGGPDPQIPLVGEMSNDRIWVERVWRAGMYVAVYNVPFAEVLWNNWSYFEVCNEGIDKVYPWLVEHWPKIVTRVERKTVRRPEWMFEYIESYFNYLNRGLLNRTILHCKDMSPQERYLYMWDDTINNIRRFGRYVALKLLESYNRYCNISLIAPDIRPKDAWSPRTTLSVLFPSWEKAMLEESNENNNMVNTAVDATLLKLWNDYDVKMDKFQLQVVLCEYRESYHSKKQYPGRSHDSELGYWYKVKDKWGTNASLSHEMFAARQRIFPHQHLGELNGWEGARKECGMVLAHYGYTWSDLLYDYKKTLFTGLGDFSQPIPQLNR